MNKLEFDLEIKGSTNILFQEGWRTGGMKKPGISIDHIEIKGVGRRIGGCCDRAQAIELRDFLNKCIEKWDKE